MNYLTNRQIKILKIIVEEYNKLFEPIGSKYVASLFGDEISSQTIRNEMAQLEKDGYLLKTHTSSGRVPSQKALEYYSINLIDTSIDKNILNKLEALFVERENNIDNVINDSLAMLSEITSLPSLSNSYYVDETLREVNLVQLNDDNALLVVVTSLGNIYKNYVLINTQSRFDDAKVCIRLINELIIGTPLIEIKDKILEIIPNIQKEVKEYEYITKEIITKLFDTTIKNSNKTNVVGITSLALYPEFKDPKVLFNILQMVESGTIWQQIKHNLDQKDNVKVEFKKTLTSDDVDKVIAIASTEIQYGDIKRQISVIGPSRIEIGKIKGILNYLKSKLEIMLKK